jgi:nucleoid-associated protein YgaU
MTRETKLGLLVGLAFAIVLGILISDHLSSTNEPLGAPLQAAGDTLRSGLGQPAGDEVAPMLRAPASITPAQPVVLNEDLNHRPTQPPVQVDAPHGSAITPSGPVDHRTDRFTDQPIGPTDQTAENPGRGGQPINPSGDTVAERLRQAAMRQGEAIVPVNDPHTVAVSTDPKPPVAPKGFPRTYQAQSGDSLGLIARKMYGSGCRANRDAIIAANPALADNRDLIVAGRTYIIPPPGTAPTPPSDQTAPQMAAQTLSADKSIIYVVQPHDTLWSIALQEVGNAGAVAAIEELNKDLLNGSDRVRPNMKLKLPKKAE